MPEITLTLYRCPGHRGPRPGGPSPMAIKPASPCIPPFIGRVDGAQRLIAVAADSLSEPPTRPSFAGLSREAIQAGKRGCAPSVERRPADHRPRVCESDSRRRSKTALRARPRNTQSTRNQAVGVVRRGARSRPGWADLRLRRLPCIRRIPRFRAKCGLDPAAPCCL